VAASTILFPGNKLTGGQSLLSPSGRYELVMQTDGNLVAYDHGNNNVAYWASNTPGNPGAFFVVQTDGNLVVYGADGKAVLWASYTQGSTPGWFVAQEDSNVVLYGIDDVAIWNLIQDNDNRSSNAQLVNKVAGTVESVVGKAVGALETVSTWVGANQELLASINAAIAVIPIAGPIVGGAIEFAEEAVYAAGELLDAIQAAEAAGEEIADEFKAVEQAASSIAAAEKQGFAQGVAMAVSNVASDAQIANLYSQLDPDSQAGFEAALKALGKTLPGVTAPPATPPAKQVGLTSFGSTLSGIAAGPRQATGLSLNLGTTPTPTPTPAPTKAPIPTAVSVTLEALQHAASLGDTAAAAALATPNAQSNGVVVAPKPVVTTPPKSKGVTAGPATPRATSPAPTSSRAAPPAASSSGALLLVGAGVALLAFAKG
jgi:hypothetical protein